MAVEAVVALMVVKLDELVRKDALLLGLHGEINRIREELNKMRRFLKDADIRQKEDEAVRDWMEDIRDICFDVGRVISILGKGQAAQGRHGFVEHLKRYISDQITRCTVSKEIKRIKLSIKGISRSRESYGIREINDERQEVTSSTQRLQEVIRCPVRPEELKIDIDGGRLEATSSSRNLEGHRSVPTLPGEPEELSLQEEINTVGQQLIEEPRLWDGTRDISEGKLEVSSFTPGLKADSVFSTPLGDSEEVGLQERINTVGQQFIKEEPGSYDGTRDIDEGRLEANSSAPCLEADGQFSTLLGESEEVRLQEEIDTVSQQLIKKEPSPSDGTRDIDEGIQEASPSSQSSQDRRQFSAVLEESEAVGQQEDIDTLEEQLMDINEGRQDNLRSSSPSLKRLSQKRQMSSDAVVPYIVGKLGDLLIQEAQLLYGVREEVEWIKNELEWIQCFLKDADSKQNTNAIGNEWVSDIIDVSYDVEDVIETFIDRQSRRHVLVGRCGLVRGVVGYISEQEVAKQIERIKQRISDISRRRVTYGTSDINEGGQEASSWIRDLDGRRRDSVMFEEAQLVGQDEEFRTVRDQLMNEEQRRRVISIFGIGGSGKTALAKKILNDVKDHFDCHALVYVSQQCNFKDVLVRIIKQVGGDSALKDMEKKDEVDLGLMLRDKYLRRKRYLVVLDDIWTTNAWDSLILKLPDDGNKSRVLVTTRIKDVALHADPSGHHHEMRLLNNDENWELFMKKIFPGEDPSTACPSDLEETGRKILAKCGCLPLAILVLGDLLAKIDKTPRAWSRVLESVNRHLSESPGHCMPILALSYWDLPYYLKPCFLYLGLFPEDYEISSNILIRLWIAEGFIQQRDDKLMEDVAEGYLEELASRSMIQVVARKSNGLVDKCRLHDLLRDLCISEASQINFFTIYQDNGTSSSSTSVRRLAFHGNVNGYETSKISTKSLRSILYFPDSEVPLSKLLNTRPKLLRVLKTENVDFSKVTLPRDIGDFAHLRYLEIGMILYYGALPPLPPSIGDLSKLQILIVRGFATLSDSIFNVKQLRHLQVWYSAIVGHPRLENLRNLCHLCLEVGSWREDGLDRLTNLRELIINGGMGSYAKTVCDSIEKLHNLQRLVLEFGDSSPTFMPFTSHLHLYEMSLNGSIWKLPELPPNLVQLTLTGSRLQEDAISTLEKLSNLKILWLGHDSYISKKMICSSGGFPRLESLTLLKLSIEELIVEEGAMPVIRSVGLNGLPNLSNTTLPSRVRELLQVEAEDVLVEEAEDDLVEEAEDGLAEEEEAEDDLAEEDEDGLVEEAEDDLAEEDEDEWNREKIRVRC